MIRQLLIAIALLLIASPALAFLSDSEEIGAEPSEIVDALSETTAQEGIAPVPGMLPQDDMRNNGVPQGPVPSDYVRERDAAQAQLGPHFVEEELLLQPFGANLFSGSFTNTFYNEMNPNYLIDVGDNISVNIWGGFTFNEILVVDSNGFIFIPTVGPVPLRGVANGNLNGVINNALSQIYNDSVEAYSVLLNSQPMSVYVTGYVGKPGRYAGGFSDSILAFIDRAGGIDPLRGSYRLIQVLRNNKVVKEIDLYPFIREGLLPNFRLREGDVIFVSRKGIGIGAIGQIRNNALFEFQQEGVTGQMFLEYVDILPDTSHVRVNGHRMTTPFQQYLSVEDFASFELTDGDIVEFVPDIPADTLTVFVDGAVVGESSFIVNKGVSLHELLNYISVSRNLADIQSIYLLRQSVAISQKQAIDAALYRLEQSVLTAYSGSREEAQLRVQEAQLIAQFVERASAVEPDGAVVVSANHQVNDIILEDRDVIVIPDRNEVVLISGEVLIPQAVVFDEGYDVYDYVAAAGGFSERADDDNILIVRSNREICMSDRAPVMPGDHIMVMPYYDSKDFQLFKEVVDVIFKLAVTTGTILRVL